MARWRTAATCCATASSPTLNSIRRLICGLDRPVAGNGPIAAAGSGNGRAPTLASGARIHRFPLADPACIRSAFRLSMDSIEDIAQSADQRAAHCRATNDAVGEQIALRCAQRIRAAENPAEAAAIEREFYGGSTGGPAP